MADVLKSNKAPKTSNAPLKSAVSAYLPDFVREAPSVPLISRDAYVAETGARLDAMQRDILSLKNAVDDAKATITRLTNEVEYVQRVRSFHEADQRQMRDQYDRAIKLGLDLKSRLDAIEAKSGGNYHGYSTFEAVSKRLTELGELEQRVKKSERDLKFAAALFCASLALLTLTLL